MAEVQNIVLFDGVCNLCNGFVQFFLKIDKRGKLKFASLQSDYGQALLAKHQLNQSDFDSFLFQQGDKLYDKSSASLQIVKTLGGFWTLLYALVIVPKPIRDAIYRFIAKNRYKWFGKEEACWLPKPEWKDRFI
jgi:predicted DCC family thiol-disulfide oxidoreductase YuxK